MPNSNSDGNGSHREKNENGYVPPKFEVTDDLSGELKLRATMVQELPQFCEAVKAGVDVLVIHQDAFASGYDVKEYILLGMAIKYAGLYGRTVQMHGTNHETF